jgi:uncharacterized protein YegJ (DUF2314 family)
MSQGFTTRIAALLSRLRPKVQTDRHGGRVDYMPGGDQPVRVPSTPQMAEAMQAAKETLAVFWAWHETRSEDPNDCALKVRFSNSKGGYEYIWLIDILRTADVVTGLVASEPEAVPDLKLWRPTAIDQDDIVDWTFRKDGLYYGHFTTRVLAASHPEVAARLDNRSETPLPADLVRH